MQPAETASTEHHNVPRSRGGSDDEINLSSISEARHAAFHRRWAENRTPCVLTRLIGLHSLGLDKRSISPETLEALFEITTLQDWSRLYKPAAMKSVAYPWAMRRSRKVAEYSVTHLLEELLTIRKTIAAIRNGGIFPAQSSSFLDQCLRFFETDSPLEAMQRFHTEEESQKETNEENDTNLLWVKSMQTETRNHIISTVEHSSLIAPHDGDWEKFLPMLRRQMQHIAQHLAEWQKGLEGGEKIPQEEHDEA